MTVSKLIALSFVKYFIVGVKYYNFIKYSIWHNKVYSMFTINKLHN